MEIQRNNLDRALGQFIEAMRMFISLEMIKEYGKSWDQEYYGCLSENQKRDWDNQVRVGKDPEQMIDYHTLGIFAIRKRDFLKKFFGYREAGNLATKFNEIADARNMLAHYDEWDEDKADLALDRKSTRLNSSHVAISYAVFCLKKKKESKEVLGDGVRKRPGGRLPFLRKFCDAGQPLAIQVHLHDATAAAEREEDGGKTEDRVV